MSVFRPKSSEEQKKGHHVRTSPLSGPKSCADKKVMTYAHVHFSAQVKYRANKVVAPAAPLNTWKKTLNICPLKKA